MAESDGELVAHLAKLHSVSPEAVQAVLMALRRGGGRMAQFSHSDFGGMSQWSPGMSMVGDMFNTQLKSKLDALCTDIAAHLDAAEAAMGRKLPAGMRSATGLKRDRQAGGVAVHALLHNRPLSVICHEESVEVEIEAVLDGGAVDFGDQTACANESGAVETDPFA
jgi:hypothetical protein